MTLRRVRDRVRDPDEDPTRWRLVLERANIPSRYWGASVEEIRDPAVVRWITETCDAAKGWLSDGLGWYVHGPLNAGKSCIAALLLMDGLLRCERGLWLAARHIPGIIFRDKSVPRSDELYAALETCDLLVIDDLGAESQRLTGPAGSTYEAAVRSLYDRERSVIVTSNLNWQDLTAQYGAVVEPLVSVLGRITTPVQITNRQWGDRPPGPGEVVL